MTCELGTLAPSAVVTITVRAAVPPGSDAASLTDVARVTSPTSDPDPDDNTAGATTDVTRNADLSVTKTVSPATVTPGGDGHVHDHRHQQRPVDGDVGRDRRRGARPRRRAAGGLVGPARHVHR